MKLDWTFSVGNLLQLLMLLGLMLKGWQELRSRLDIVQQRQTDMEKRHTDTSGQFRDTDMRADVRLQQVSVLLEATSGVVSRVTALYEQLDKRLTRLENTHDQLHKVRG